jgi:hypothetical protein
MRGDFVYRRQGMAASAWSYFGFGNRLEGRRFHERRPDAMLAMT